MEALREELARWGLDGRAVRQRMYAAPTPRERERWHALWLLTLGWTNGRVAEALERDAHTIGAWLTDCRGAGPASVTFEHTGGPPPALDREQQAALKAAVQRSPQAAGIERANWNWKHPPAGARREFVQRRFGIRPRRSACRTYLHRLGFVLKRPQKRLVKADAAKRQALVRAYAALRREAEATSAQVFFVDEAHFYADVDLHATWVLKGEPALVDATSPRWGEKASYYSAVCLETGEVAAMPLGGNSSAETSVAFLQQLRARFAGPLIVVWDNAPAHGGDALRAYLRTPDLRLRLVRLPASSPDFNGGAHWAQAIWGWIREEVTANTCFGTAAKVREQVDAFFHGVADRAAEVKQRCRTALQASVEALIASPDAYNADPVAA